MTTGSRLGESRMDRESRQWFRKLTAVVACITLALLIAWAVMEWWA